MRSRLRAILTRLSGSSSFCVVIITIIVVIVSSFIATSSTVSKCSIWRAIGSSGCETTNDTMNNGECTYTTSGLNGEKVTRNQRVMTSYRPHGNLARLVLDKQSADKRLEAYDKTQWYSVDKTKIREDILKLWIPLGAGPCHDRPDKTAENFIAGSTEKSESMPLQAWYMLAQSALSWFISQTSINGLLGRGSMHIFSTEQFQKLLDASGFAGPWDSVIDLGAGDGGITAQIAHLFDKVYATDISAPMRRALAKRKFTVLDVDKWHTEAGPYNVVLCLNLLDRCDRPATLLQQLRSTLAPGGRLVIALVLPFSPYVEVGHRGDHLPSQYLAIKGDGLEGQIVSLIDRVFAPVGFKCLAWTKLPYLCEGNLLQSYCFLDDVIFVLEAQQQAEP